MAISIDETWAEFRQNCPFCLQDTHCNHPRRTLQECSEDRITGKRNCPRIKKRVVKQAPPWKEDFEGYTHEATQGFRETLKDAEWMETMRLKYPSANVEATIKKAAHDYWLTERGWNNKRKKASEKIDWKKTYEYPLYNSNCPSHVKKHGGIGGRYGS